jgi:large subunit ribosomal protein L14e
LTKYVLKIQHGARRGTVLRAWAKAEVDKKWAESAWSKRIEAKKRRLTLTDFERFKLMKAKQAVIYTISVIF